MMTDIEHQIRMSQAPETYEDSTPHSPYSPRVYGAIAALVLLAGMVGVRMSEPVHSRRAAFAGSLALGVMVLGILAMSVSDGFPHEAPTGWSYPLGCCSGIDCREVPDADIIEGARGYEIRKTHELIPMTDPKVKQSPDGKFHLCSVGGLDDGRTICLFAPSRGF